MQKQDQPEGATDIAPPTLQRLVAMGEEAARLVETWPDLRLDARKQRLGLLADQLHGAEGELRMQAAATPSGDVVIDLTDAGSGPAPPEVAHGSDVAARVLSIVGCGGGIDEVLAYLIHELRPYRAPIFEAIGYCRQGVQDDPVASRAVELLSAALRTGLFR